MAPTTSLPTNNKVVTLMQGVARNQKISCGSDIILDLVLLFDSPQAAPERAEAEFG